MHKNQWLKQIISDAMAYNIISDSLILSNVKYFQKMQERNDLIHFKIINTNVTTVYINMSI